MADFKKRVPENAPGDFFVDSTCIDCDTCRQLAPAVFGEAEEYSFVQLQPRSGAEEREALRALLACPTGSIGTRGSGRAGEVKSDFPLRLEEDLYYNGFTSRDSFGGSSYLLRRGEENWLIDSPRYLPYLVKRFEELGGIRRIFLTHRDDVADAAKYARHFSSERIIHRLERFAQPDAERFIDGFEPVPLADGFLVIPTPGHTRGHCALLVGERYLFTGDHLWWSRRLGGLNASRSVCWHSWAQQKESIRQLLDYRFEWVLPGHGERVRLPAAEMAEELRRLVNRLE
ncbi:MAG: MBL fold metallo-hydrolase [Bryobacteraceae bacterium]|nr:MBL fold metallo-hydrolase [Bryobacteraceae bacterium]